MLLRTASAARSASSALTSANISTTGCRQAAPLHFRALQDPAPQDHRHLCHASASADRGDQARPSDRSAALRHRITANEKETRGACLFFCPEQALGGERSALATAGRTAQLRRASVLRSKSLAEGRFICPGHFNTGGWGCRRRRRNPDTLLKRHNKRHDYQCIPQYLTCI